MEARPGSAGSLNWSPFVLPCDVVALSPLGSSVLTGAPACLSGFALLDVLQHVGGSYDLMSDSGHGLQSF